MIEVGCTLGRLGGTKGDGSYMVTFFSNKPTSPRLWNTFLRQDGEANAHWGSHMNILFIIKVKIPVLITWSYKPPIIMLTIEYRVVKTHVEHTTRSHYGHMSVAIRYWSHTKPQSTHIYRYPNKKSNGIRVVYCIHTCTWSLAVGNDLVNKNLHAWQHSW